MYNTTQLAWMRSIRARHIYRESHGRYYCLLFLLTFAPLRDKTLRAAIGRRIILIGAEALAAVLMMVCLALILTIMIVFAP